MTTALYNSWKAQANVRNWLTANFKVMLVDDTYAQDIDAHTKVSDVVAKEIVGTNVARKAITTPTRVVDNANDRCDYGADNLTWTALDVTNPRLVGGAIVYYDPGTGDANCELVCFLDTTDVDPNGVDFVIKWNAGATAGTVWRFS